jgi:hypothetical protein
MGHRPDATHGVYPRVARAATHIDKPGTRPHVRGMAARPTDTLSTLQHVLASAARIAQDLTNDPLLPRLLDIFARMPAEDREILANVLEREVDLRNLSKEAPSGPLSGLNVTKPNPNARLYFRVADRDPPPFVTPEEIVQAVIRAARVIHRAAGRRSDLSQVWEPAMIEGLRRVPPAERDVLRWYHRTILQLIDESEREPH